MKLADKIGLANVWRKREKAIKDMVDDILRYALLETNTRDLSFSTDGRSMKFPIVHRVQVFLVIPESVGRDTLTFIIPELVSRYSAEYHVVWFEIAHSKENADNAIWVCQLQWVDEKLDASLKPNPLGGQVTIKKIEVKWG